MRGRKPKPVALKMLTMNATRAKKFRIEHPVAIVPLVALVDAPEWLSDTQKTEGAMSSRMRRRACSSASTAR
jgi:hypothetical protein